MNVQNKFQAIKIVHLVIFLKNTNMNILNFLAHSVERNQNPKIFVGAQNYLHVKARGA